MGKRSNFERHDKDFYQTPYSAVVPLLPHLCEQTLYVEPCFGDGALVISLARHGHVCAFASDIDDRGHGNCSIRDARTFKYNIEGTFFITNPPWSRTKKRGYLMHRIIENLSSQKPTWLLFDADWMHTIQAKEYLKYCIKIVSVGRVSWMGNNQSGVDNSAWYLFDQNRLDVGTTFYGR